MRVISGLLYFVLLTVSAIATSEAGTIRHVNRTDAGCGGQSPCYGNIQAAVNAAQPGDTVLLSPACSSLDMFRDYTHRGNAFAAAVKELAAGESGR